MSASSRRPETRRRQQRKVKIDKLRQRYVKAHSSDEKNAIFTKVKVMSPQMTLDQFTGTSKAKA